MSTKAEVINDAYDEIRVSGLTVSPSPSDLVKALSRLEGMMSELFTSWNLNVGYNFENTPNINSQTNVPLAYEPMMRYGLAVRLIPMFNKEVPATLLQLAASSLSGAQGSIAAQNIRQIQPSRRMPKGSGNTFRGQFWNRFMQPVVLPPPESATSVIAEGERQDYSESFAAWLGSNTIASFTIAVDPRLTLNASANADPLITYTVTAIANDSYGPWQFVKITVTDSAGRVEIRLINFEVTTVPTVPSP